METRPKSYRYRTKVKWTGEKIGEMEVSGKPSLQVATPPEFKGHEGIWSPEDLFVASVNSCLMTTFLAFAERAHLAFEAFESDAEGTLERVDKKFEFTEIVLKPKVTLKPGEDREKAMEILSKAEAACLISNSIKATVSLVPTVEPSV